MSDAVTHDEDVTDIAVDTAILLSVANGFVDAYTYVGHGGVFANAQSGNVILLGVDLAHPGSGGALDHLWPLLAFIAGVLVARRVGNGVLADRFRDPRALVLAFQVVILVLVALLPSGAPEWMVTTTIGFAAALQFVSFKTVRSSKFVPILMTGNLMRTVEAFDDVLHHHADRRMAALYSLLMGAFVLGALTGALATEHLDRATPLFPAALLLVTAALVYRRAGRQAV